MLNIHIITIFPEFFKSPLSMGILRRGLDDNLVSVECVDLRQFTDDPHRTVDDYPYGGGAGMVLKPEPVFRAMKSLEDRSNGKREVVLLSAKGKPLDQKEAVRLSMVDSIVMLCGRYKDIDERVRENLATCEISIGDYILSGGEAACLVLLDAVVRLMPGVMGDFESALDDSFSDGLLSAPVYTRPRNYEGMSVPEVLLTGDHDQIKRWRYEKSCQLTRERRPDLWEKYLESQRVEEGEQ
jgi:tRNA (guanine37-N1)-methyltransferase